jgi:hypothetical protein
LVCAAAAPENNNATAVIAAEIRRPFLNIDAS